MDRRQKDVSLDAPEIPGENSQTSFDPKAMVHKAGEVRRRIPKSVKIKLKILFSLIMFASLFLFGKVDLNKTWQALLHTNPWIIGATTTLLLSTIIIQAHRWQIIAGYVGFKRSLGEMVRYYYVGMFFNLFLPSTVGGDFSRCYYLSKGEGKYGRAFYSVIADRASGIAVLFLSATLGLLLSPDAASLPWQLKWPIFAGTFALFCVMPFMPWLTRTVLGQNNWIARQFNDSALNIFWTNKPLIALALVWSIIAQLLMVVCHIGVGMALNLNVPLWYYFIFYPAVAVLGFITPSFNGIGIREWAYTYFLMMVGIDRAHGLTYALLWLALTTLTSLVGGLVYAASHMSPPPPQVEEETEQQVEANPA
jgi:uncharacterized membrane protein YbhN (UPF0104 family)